MTLIEAQTSRVVRSRCFTALLASALLLAVSGATNVAVIDRAHAEAAPSVPRSLTAITESLYRVEYGMHVSVLLVTAEGIVVTDPTNPEAARWLRAEIKKRFNKPIRYLIYSHGHSDHIGGAAELATPSVTILANQLTKQHLVEDPHPGANIPIPTQTFTGEITLKLGGQTIKLFQVEPWTHAPDLIAVQFLEQRTVWAPDLISVKAVGFLDFSNERFLQMIQAIERVQQLDYTYLIDSHGPPGTKADADRFLQYLSELKAAARKAVSRGQDLEQAKQSINLEQYEDLAFFKVWSGLNIEGAVEAVRLEANGNVPTAQEPAITPERLAGLIEFCAVCHGRDGISPAGAYPNLAGQKYEYLVKALHDYQVQRRYDPYMSELEFITDEEIAALARYYSTVNPAK